MRLKMPNGSVLEYRVDADGEAFWRWDASDVPGHWLKIGSPERSALVVELLKMEARANEYHDTTMQQAKRIAELEVLRDSLVGIALQVAALPLLAELQFGDGRSEATDEIIRHARDTLDDFVLVPTGSL